MPSKQGNWEEELERLQRKFGSTAFRNGEGRRGCASIAFAQLGVVGPWRGSGTADEGKVFRG